jgi:hypothetical protein
LNLHRTVGLLSFLLSVPTLAAAPPSASLDTFSLGYRGEYFFSTQNLSNDAGDTDSLQFDGEYTNFSNNFEFAYTLPASLRFALGGTFAIADSSTVFEPRSNSKFNRVSVGAQYYKNVGRFLFVPMVLVHIASEKIEPNQNEVFTSEGTNQYQFGGWVKVPIWKFDTWAYLGARIQDDDKANHILWSFGTRWYPGSWYLSGEILGATVVTNDRFSDVPSSRTLVNNVVAAGSLKYNSVDPDFIDGEIMAGFRTKSGYEFAAGVNHTITGKNTGYGPTLLASFTMDFRMDEKPLDSANRVSETGNFQPDYETYDESIFTDE